MKEAQTQTAYEALPNIGYYESLGMMLWLMTNADYHSQWPLWSVDVDIVPPLLLGQCKVYLDQDSNPVGFVTWAWLNDVGKQKALNRNEPLDEEDWRAGPHVMANDFVAPWGHAKALVRDLKLNVFRREKVFSIGRNKDGSKRKIYHWRGVDYTDTVYRNNGQCQSVGSEFAGRR